MSVIAGLAFGVLGLAVQAQSSEARKPPAKPCEVALTSVKLVLSGEDRHARAEYIVGGDCEPVLREVVYSRRIPSVRSNRGSVRTAFRTPREATLETAAGSEATRPSPAAHACTIDVWEEDVVAVPRITLRNSTSWETAAGRIVGARVHQTAFPNLDWWFVDGKPTARIAYVSEPFTARSSASDAYYCSGSGSLSRYVCRGPSYRISLEADIFFDGGGTCSGEGRAVGTLVPGGRVRFEVTRGSK